MLPEPSANPKYVLTYFNAKALAEPIRFLFAYGNIQYEDDRFQHEDWPSIKPTMPMGQAPVLSVDGHRMCQSISIARYMAKRVGLAGSTDWEALQIDIMVDIINDFRAKLAGASYEKNETAKNEKYAELDKDVIPFVLQKLETIVKENNGYLALGKLTWADFYFVGIYDYLNLMANKNEPNGNLLANAPNLQELCKKVCQIESIRKWIEIRPDTKA